MSNLAPMSRMDAKRHELLADVAETMAVKLVKVAGLTTEQAAQMGNELADFLSDHWKGQTVYFVGDLTFKLAARDMEIFQAVERGNADDIGRKYGISGMRVYQINQRVLKALRAKMQDDLFAGDNLNQVQELSTGH